MNLGYSYIGSSASLIELEILGKTKKIELRYKFEFNSTRKRMSCIVKENDYYKMFIKGADSVIRARLKGIQNEKILYDE